MYRVTFKEIHPIVLLWLPSYLKAGHKQCSNSVLCFICDSNIGQHFNTFSEKDGAFKKRMEHIHCIWFHARPLYQRIALGHTFWWTWYFNFKALSYKNKKSHKSDESKWSGAMRDICSAPANSFPTAHDKKRFQQCYYITCGTTNMWRKFHPCNIFETAASVGGNLQRSSLCDHICCDLIALDACGTVVMTAASFWSTAKNKLLISRSPVSFIGIHIEFHQQMYTFFCHITAVGGNSPRVCHDCCAKAWAFNR